MSNNDNTAICMIKPRIIALRGEAKSLRKNAHEVITIASVNKQNNTFSIFLDLKSSHH